MAPGVAARILPRLAFYPFLVASLLIFTAWLPWMILGWILLAGVRWARGKTAWPVLGFGLGITIVKRPDSAPALIALLLLIAAAAVWDWRLRAPEHRPPALHRKIAFLMLSVAWTAMAWSWTSALHTSRHPALAPDRPIVVVGDSLSVMGFPRVLKERLRVPVINHSRGGITTIEALAFYPEVLASKPQTVILELGGHDFLRGKPRAQTKENLARMIHDARAVGAEVILFEIPHGFITDPYGGLERELARELDVEVIPDGAIRDLVLFSPFTPLGSWTGRQLSYDGLHPNEDGHVFLADRAEAALRRVYGDAILK